MKILNPLYWALLAAAILLLDHATGFFIRTGRTIRAQSSRAPVCRSGSRLRLGPFGLSDPEPPLRALRAIQQLIGEGHDQLAAEVVATDPSGRTRAPVRMRPNGDAPNRYVAHVTPDVEGEWTWEFDGVRYRSSNITPDPSGISYYSEELFIRTMRTGNLGGY